MLVPRRHSEILWPNSWAPCECPHHSSEATKLPYDEDRESGSSNS